MNLIDNRLFAQLTSADQASLARIGSPSRLASQQVIGAPLSTRRDVYFLTGASVALVVRDGLRPGLALGLVGHEGAVGLHFALGFDPGVFTLLVQSPGTAWRFDGLALERLARKRIDLLVVLSKYIWTLAQEIALFSAFAQVSDVKPRLARWLLASVDRTDGSELMLTQSHLAEMLGVRRASVNSAASALKEEGLVDYRRGRLRVLDVAGLYSVAHRVSEPPEPRPR